jgi:formamidopyrimidine-DNA glycosylase
MPELPEVETVCRGIRPSLKGRLIKNVLVRNRSLRQKIPADFEKTIKGKTVESVVRRAKYIVINLSGNWSILWHLGMSGRVSVVFQPKPEFQKHDHVAFEIEGETWVIYNDTRRFGLMLLLKTDELETHKLLKDIGPEPLSNQFHAPVLQANLAGKKTPIKQALLDQRVVAGVGNIYACEALFMSKINPKTPSSEVSLKKLEELCVAIREVLLAAIEAGGSTLKDHAQVDGELGYFQHSFKVYGRVGESCVSKNCKDTIAKTTQAGRSTFYCPNCQK